MKLFLFLILVLSLLPTVFAADVAYILDDKSADNVLISSIEDLGLEIDLIDYNNLPDFSEYKLILVHNERFDDASLIPIDKNILLILDNSRTDNIEEWGFGSSISYTSRRRGKVYDLEHEIREGLDDVFDVYTTSSTIYRIRVRPSGVKRIIVKEDDYSFGMVFAVDQGAQVNGRVSESRAVIFGLPETSKWTDDAELLFQNSIMWLINGNDEDDDGIEDRDDNCVFDYNPEQEDLDGDEIGDECDDDRDGDGYDGEEAGGEDCDDEDDDVYPGAYEYLDGKDNNCVNDAPRKRNSYLNLPNKIIQENQYVFQAYDLENYFADPDGDLLDFDVFGNVNIDVEIVNKKVNLIPEQDWNGFESFYFTASDGEFETDSNSVTITVVPVNDCTSQDGFICTEDEMCEEWLESEDEEYCCSVQCEEMPLNFTDINVCESKNESIDIRIVKPYSGRDFKPGDLIEFEIEITNNLDETFQGDIEAYLYSIENDEAINDKDDEFKIKKDEKEKVNFEFEIPYNIEEGTYALYVKVEDEICNEKYVEIDIIKNDEDVIINSLNIDKEAYCGEDIDFTVEIVNIGDKDVDVYVVVENSDLGLREESEEFELREGEEDEIDFSFRIPENIENNDYSIKATVYFAGTRDYISESLNIKGCVNQIVNLNGNNSFNFNPSSSDIEDKDNENNNLWFIVGINGVFILAIIGFFVWVFIKNHIFQDIKKFMKKKRKRRK